MKLRIKTYYLGIIAIIPILIILGIKSNSLYLLKTRYIDTPFNYVNDKSLQELTQNGEITEPKLSYNDLYALKSMKNVIVLKDKVFIASAPITLQNFKSSNAKILTLGQYLHLEKMIKYKHKQYNNILYFCCLALLVLFAYCCIIKIEDICYKYKHAITLEKQARYDLLYYIAGGALLYKFIEFTAGKEAFTIFMSYLVFILAPTIVLLFFTLIILILQAKIASWPKRHIVNTKKYKRHYK